MTRSHRKSRLPPFRAENIFRKSHQRNFSCWSSCLSNRQKCALGGNFTPPPLAVEGLNSSLTPNRITILLRYSQRLRKWEKWTNGCSGSLNYNSISFEPRVAHFVAHTAAHTLNAYLSHSFSLLRCRMHHQSPPLRNKCRATSPGLFSDHSDHDIILYRILCEAAGSNPLHSIVYTKDALSWC